MFNSKTTKLLQKFIEVYVYDGIEVISGRKEIEKQKISY